MLFIYRTPKATFEYFEIEYTERVKFDKSKIKVCNNCTQIARFEKTYIVGNDLSDMINKNLLESESLDQSYIDVMMFGLAHSTLEKYGLEAVVYVYNNWLMPENPLFKTDIAVCSMLVRELPDNVSEIHIPLTFNGGSRFEIILSEVQKARKQSNFVGAAWPTCHYASHHMPYLVLMYTK